MPFYINWQCNRFFSLNSIVIVFWHWLFLLVLSFSVSLKLLSLASLRFALYLITCCSPLEEEPKVSSLFGMSTSYFVFDLGMMDLQSAFDMPLILSQELSFFLKNISYILDMVHVDMPQKMSSLTSAPFPLDRSWLRFYHEVCPFSALSLPWIHYSDKALKSVPLLFVFVSNVFFLMIFLLKVDYCNTYEVYRLFIIKYPPMLDRNKMFWNSFGKWC